MHDFITKYSKNRDFGYTLIVDVDYPEYLQILNKCLSCLSEKIVIQIGKTLAYIFYKRNYRCQDILL